MTNDNNSNKKDSLKSTPRLDELINIPKGKQKFDDILKQFGPEDFDFSKVLGNTTPSFSSLSDSNHNATMSRLREIGDRIAEEKNKEKRELEQYRESVLVTLQGIEKNTAVLKEMSMLLQKHGEKQDEIFAIMIEIMEIMKCSNKEEAETKFAAVTRKIATVSEHASTVTSLVGIAKTVYDALPF
ncbi:hypothetical protein NQ129_26395 [Priestia aryabhattai]|uniref:hypothetical protein n=1 Tax=Priestia aryabhattai TaxID=412384 RepID=UPI00211C40CE|nr:hypothetical protein [Priestia aryabhattai]MCQ9285299.1 hypothetical protein [Priestia aryabhattai]